MFLRGARSGLCVSLWLVLLAVGLFCIAGTVGGAEPADKSAVTSGPAETPAAEAAAAEAESTEEESTEEKSAAEQPAADAGPAPDFSKLAEPVVAERLQLSDEQRAELAALLTERAKALADAAEADKSQALRESDRKLAALLTAEQLAQFKKLQPEPRLQFQFRFERWADVLQWFAEQAELSLVLDAPPPGTFNYSDAKQYTPTEAIDLLNGVLLTKGYTLVRRGRMLVVLDLKDGIPEGIVPKIGIGDLDKRGKFELVTVAFPLGRRPADTVSSEIALLLSPNGKVVPMPATSQLLVTDTAGIMRAIAAVIESIAEPPAVPTPSKPESPVAKVYSLKPADPKTVVEVLTAMVPDAKIVPDASADQIHVHTTPSQHALIQEVLEQMQAGHAPEKRPRLETYPVAEAGAEAILQTVQTLVPDARITLDANTGKLVAFGPADAHETIRQTLDKLEGERSPARTPQFEVYRVTKVDPEATLNLLQNILPDARLTVDTRTRTLIAVAIPADHDVIRRTLAQLQPEKPAPDVPELRYYPLALTLTPDSITALKRTVPGATVALEANGDRLMVVATPEEHVNIKATIGQIETAAFAKLQSKLVVYPVSLAQRKRFMAVMETLSSRLPGVRVIEDAEPGELSVWAKPQQHEVLVEILGELKRDVPNPEKYDLVTYPIRSADPANVLTVLTEMFPETKLVLDEQTDQLLVWTRPDQQASIKAALEKIDTGPPADQRPGFQVYRIRGDADELLATLQTLVPEAQLNVDAGTGNLIAWGTPDEQEKIKAALGELRRGSAGGGLQDTAQLEVYKLTKADPDSTLELLTEMLPDARLSIDAKSGSLIALAIAEDHRAIRALLEQLQPVGPDPDAPVLQFYPLVQPPPEGMVTVLENAAPKANITLEPGGRHLTVLASPADHEVIKRIVERVEETAPLKEKNKLVIYPVTPAQRKRFTAVEDSLTADLPGIKIVADAQPHELAIWAKPTQHVVIAQTIAELDRDVPAEQRHQLVVYPVTPAQRKRLEAVLEGLSGDLPGVKVIADGQPGEMAVWAKAEQHLQIGRMLDQLKTQVPADQRDQLVAYQIRSADPASVLSVLEKLFPDAQIVLDEKARRLAVWTRPQQQQAIRAAIEQLDSDVTPELQQTIQVYPVRDADPEVAIGILQQMLPEAKFQSDTTAGTIIATAVVRDQQRISEILDQLQVAGSPENRPRLEVYPYSYPTSQDDSPAMKALRERLSQAGVELPEPSSLLTALKKLVPKAEFTLDKKGKRLLAVATPEDHELIKAAVEQAAQGMVRQERQELVVYPIRSADPASAAKLLEGLFPELQIVRDEKTGRLAVWATAAEHLAIGKAIAQLDSRGPADGQAEVAVYPIRQTDPEVAVGILQELLPEATFQSDTTAGTIVATAGKEDHARIKRIVEQFHSAPDERPRLEVYPVDTSDAAGLIATLQPVVPEALLSVDPTGGKLVAWAAPEDHEALKTAIEKLGQGGPLFTARQVEVYRLTKADPDTTLALLQTLVPGARLSTDPNTRSLVALATPAEHQTIRSTVEQLQPIGPGPDAPQLQFYPLLRRPPPDMITGLQELAPQAQITLAADGRNLMVVATAEDHKVISAALDKVEETVGLEERSQLVVYPVSPAQRKRFQAVLESVTEELPGIRVITDAEPGELSVWAKPTQHLVIGQIIEQLKRDVPEEEKLQLIAYPIATADPDSVMSILTELFPEAKLVLDRRSRRVMAWTRPEDHRAIRSALQQMDSGTPGAGQETFKAHPISEADPAVAIEMLGQLLPEVKLSSDTTAGTIVAFARQSEHEMIAKAIQQLQAGPDPQHRPKIVEYPAGDGDPESIQTMLAGLAPSAQVVVDAKRRSLIVLAKPKDHETVAAAVQQMSQKAPEGQQPIVGMYMLDAGSTMGTYYRMRLLREAVRGATFTLGNEPGQVIAWARPQEHEQIQALIEQISAKPPPEKARKLVVYTLEQKTAANAEDVLDEIVPNAALEVDGANPQKLNAWAVPSDHEMIATVLKQIDVAEPPDAIASVKVYTVDASGRYGGYYTMRLLRDAVPGATFTTGSESNQVIAWARPKDHELIQATLDQMAQKPPPEKTPKLVVYTLKQKTAADVEHLLEDVVPDARLTVDGSNPQKLNAWAIPADHELIEQILAEIDVEEPPESARSVEVYALDTAEAAEAVAFLETLVPEATLTPGTDPHQIVAWARPADHQKINSAIQRLSQEEPPETAPRAAVYTIPSSSLTASIYTVRLLREAAPGATFTLGADPGQVIVWARPKDHQTIKQLVEQLDEKAPPEKAPKLIVYTLSEKTAADAMGVLQDAVADARFTLDTDPKKLNAWATPRDHVTIQEIVGQIDVAEPAESAPMAEVYTLRSTTAAEALPFLTGAFPGADFTAGSDPRQLIVWARPAEHLKIEAVVEQLSAEETAPKVVTYTLTTAGAARAMELLATAMPTAQFAVGADPGQLVAYARPADHELIGELVKQLEAGGLADTNRVLAVYPMRKEDVPSMLGVLDPQVKVNARFVTDTGRDGLIVWADPKTQAAVKNAVEQFLKELPEPIEPTSQVYRFRNADPAAAYSVLGTLVPEAEIALDTTNRSLVVSALPEDHLKIAATIAEMDREDAEGAPKLKIHRVASADLTNLLGVLQLLFQAEPEVQLSVDAANDAVVAVATPAQHQKITELIKEVEAAGADSELQLYSLRNVDSYSAIGILENVLKKHRAKAELSVDSGTNQLVAIARAEDHKLIQSTLEQLRTEDRELEIFQLDFVEPDTAELAISNLFRDEGFSNMPDVDSDPDSGQLFVRGTDEQLKEIRELLVKLGETGLTSLRSGGNDRLRVVPFYGDAKAAVAEIQRIWPQLRDNPIRVVTPDEVTPMLRDSGKPTEEPSEDPGAKGEAGKPGEAAPKGAHKTAPGKPAGAHPPVLVVLGEGNITIASEDPAALDQFESLLTTMMRRTGYSGRDFSIYTIRNTSATRVAATLTSLFRSTSTSRTGYYGSSRRSTQRVIIVPDERLNSILVKGSRADRAKIEDLLKILDTQDDSRRLKIIPLKRTNATRVQQALDAILQHGARVRRSSRD